MASVYLIRHAEPVASGQADRDRPLSELGRRQAEAAGERLAHVGVKELLTAPHARCRETAELIGHALGIEPVVDERLHILRSFELPRVKEETVWVAHSNNIPGALERAGIPCHACGHASIWQVELETDGGLAGSSYWEPSI